MYSTTIAIFNYLESTQLQTQYIQLFSFPFFQFHFLRKNSDTFILSINELIFHKQERNQLFHTFVWVGNTFKIRKRVNDVRLFYDQPLTPTEPPYVGDHVRRERCFFGFWQENITDPCCVQEMMKNRIVLQKVYEKTILVSFCRTV